MPEREQDVATRGRKSAFAFTAIALLAIFGVANSVAQSEAPGARRMRGQDLLELIRTGDYGRAEAILRRQLHRDPDGRLHYLLGAVLTRQLRWAEAEPFLVAATERQPARGPWLETLAQVHLELDRCREAIVVLERAWKVAPSWNQRHDIAMCALDLGDLERAEKELREVHAAAPETGRTRTKLGKILLDSGRPGEALPILVAAADNRPDDLEARFALGLAQRRTGDLEAATASFEAVLEMLPTHVGAAYNLGQTLTARGDRQAGRAALQRFRSLSDLEDRIDNHRLYVRGHPDDVDARMSLGRLLIEAGRHEEALGHVRVARNLAPERAEVAALLAIALRGLGRYDEALDAERVARNADDGVP